jgi:hypothetical protein
MRAAARPRTAFESGSPRRPTRTRPSGSPRLRHYGQRKRC